MDFVGLRCNPLAVDTLYCSVGITDDDWAKASDFDLYDKYIFPASLSIAKSLDSLGPKVYTASSGKPPGLSHYTYVSGLRLRGQLGYDGMRQVHLIALSTNVVYDPNAALRQH